MTKTEFAPKSEIPKMSLQITTSGISDGPVDVRATQ